MSGSIKYFDQWKGVMKALNLNRLAREAGFCRRTPRKIKPSVWLWSMVLGSLAGPKRTLAALTRVASIFSRQTITRQAFHQRFSAPAVEFLQRACLRLMEKLGDLSPDEMPPKFACFKDLSLIDSTTVRLAQKLAKRFPACRTNVRKAALKIHTQMSLAQRDVQRLQFTAERVHDRRGQLFGSWVKDRLLLFDLGYFDYGLFAKIEEEGGSFVTRLKSTSNGTILHVRQGCLQREVGGDFNARIYQGRVVDLDVLFGKGRNEIPLRTVGIWNRQRKDYHWYVTSLSEEDFSAEDIAEVYPLRWQIELLFMDWKSLCRLTELPSAKENVVLALIWASLCACLLSRVLLCLSARRYRLSLSALSPPLVLSILSHYVLVLGRALSRRATAPLRSTLSDLLDTLAVHAHVPNTSNAMLAFANADS